MLGVLRVKFVRGSILKIKGHTAGIFLVDKPARFRQGNLHFIFLAAVDNKDALPMAAGTDDILQVKQEVGKLLDEDPRPDFIVGLHGGEACFRTLQVAKGRGERNRLIQDATAHPHSANISTGRRNCPLPIPVARMAMISLSPAMRLRPIRVPTSIAIGIVITRILGSGSRNRKATWDAGRLLRATSSRTWLRGRR